MYHCKYHIENILNRRNEKHGIYINNENRQVVYKIFELINGVLPQVSGEWKRMISINFFIQKVFQIMKLPSDNIKITSFKKALKYYNQWWNGLIKHDIYKVIDK